MRTHDTQASNLHPQNNHPSNAKSPFAPRSFETTFPGEEKAASPDNPFPRHLRETWSLPPAPPKPSAASPQIAAKASSPDQTTTGQPETETKPLTFNFGQIRIFAEGQDPPDPPNHHSWPWHRVQPKLTVGQPNDTYEQEADQMAAQVMAMPDPAPKVQCQPEENDTEEGSSVLQTKPLAETITPLVQRQPEHDNSLQLKCETCDQEDSIQRTATSAPQVQPDLESRLSTSQASGSPLPDEVRGFMEPRFGSDFSQVRVHTDREAVQMNQELGAQAFTHGAHIYYGAGKAPAKDELTGHELTHVVQQTSDTNLSHSRGKDTDINTSVETPLSVQPMLQCTTSTNIQSKFLNVEILQREPTASSPTPTSKDSVPGQHENQQVGTWGVWSKTPLIAGKREKEDFATREAAIAYARGMGKAASVFQEDGKFVVYPITYSSLIYSFTYSGTRMFHGSNISDVMGIASVLALVTEDGTAILPHQYGGENDYKSWMEQQDALKPGENPFDSHKEAFGEGLGKITGKEKFLRQFELAMRDTVLGMLDRSQQEAKTKQQEMAKGLPDKDAKIIHKAAKELEEVDKQLTTWKAKQSNLSAVVQDPVPFNEELNNKAKQELEEASKQVADLELQRKTILLDYPLLSQINPADFNKLNDADQAKMLGGASGQVLKDIEETRKNVTSGDLNLWAIDPIVKSTLAGLGINDPERQNWAKDKAKLEKRIDTAISIALGVLQIGFSIAATAVGGPAGVAFAVGALGVGVADATRMTDKYFQDKAAANTDISKDKALVPQDLEGQWAWLVVAWVGVGLSYVDVIKAVRAVKVGAGAAEVIASESSKLAKASGVEESVIAKAAGQAGKTPPDQTALRKLLLSALPDEKMAAKFKDLPVTVLTPEDFIQQFGSTSGEAVTTFKQGKDGELIAEVFFKETGNPLAMREEAVHIAQAADKEMGAKLAKLSESNLGSWSKMEAEQKLQLYKTKIEVEIDAHKRLLAQFAGGDPEYLAKVESNLKNLQTRLGEVEQAIKDPELAKQGKLPWLDSNQPPRLFSKEYKGVEIIDAKGKPIGEFDHTDVAGRIFFEDTSAEGLHTLNPRTGLPAQTVEEWAMKKIFAKTDARIKNLASASATRATKAGSSTVPSIDEIRSIHQLKFRLEVAATPEIESAVNKAIGSLRAKYPNWTFSVIYGFKP